MARGPLLLVLIAATIIVVPVCMAMLLDWGVRRIVATLDDPVVECANIDEHQAGVSDG